MSFGPSSLYSIKIEEPEEANSWFPTFSLFVDTDLYDKEFDKFFVDGHTYYSVPNRCEYRVRMSNNSGLRVNATLKIDGEIMGTWRIEPFSDVAIERPAHTDRKFVFVKEDSREARMGDVTRGKYENGLVEVTFVPEKIREYHRRCYQKEKRSLAGYVTPLSPANYMYSMDMDQSTPALQSCNSSSNATRNMGADYEFASGATVLGEDSNQSFTDADYMIEDASRQITKRVRLVIKGARKPFASIKKSYNGVYDDYVPPRIDGKMRHGPRPEECDVCMYHHHHHKHHPRRHHSHMHHPDGEYLQEESRPERVTAPHHRPLYHRSHPNYQDQIDKENLYGSGYYYQ